MKLMNKFAGVILVNISLNLPQAIFLFREFVTASVPKEIEEAADLDGCSPMRKFFTVILPLLIFYVVMQKHIISGVAAGSVKG